MKKVILTTTLAFIGIIGAFVACKQYNISPKSITESPKGQLFISASTDILSNNSRSLGISEIQLASQDSISLTYKMIASSITYNDINDYSLNNRVLKFTTIGHEIVMTYQDNKSILYDTILNVYSFASGGDTVAFTDDSAFEAAFNGFITRDQDEFGWGLYVFEEIRNKNLIREPRSLNRPSGGRYSAVQLGRSRSVLTADCNKWIEGFLRDNPGCAQVGSLDVSCIWDNHGCIATASFDC